ncbi:Nif11-like leader peptide family RiPP precursor [Synechococcus sp. UW179A]|uniref:Nif11-like leader peptide family RiPP precursor n=1 Tax=Synechococcus sp. UW179A TaxID=2575510 RepID=UPI000E0E9F0B|nr:Nif11-like leader peptide family RiPP precursor [Synechococcus sp. UW179A]
MTEEQLTAFLANAKENGRLQEQLKAAADTKAVAAIAKQSGLNIYIDGLIIVQPRLSDNELEGVAGGRGFSYLPQQCVTDYLCG